MFVLLTWFLPEDKSPSLARAATLAAAAPLSRRTLVGIEAAPAPPISRPSARVKAAPPRPAAPRVPAPTAPAVPPAATAKGRRGAGAGAECTERMTQARRTDDKT